MSEEDTTSIIENLQTEVERLAAENEAVKKHNEEIAAELAAKEEAAGTSVGDQRKQVITSLRVREMHAPSADFMENGSRYCVECSNDTVKVEYPCNTAKIFIGN